MRNALASQGLELRARYLKWMRKQKKSFTSKKDPRRIPYKNQRKKICDALWQLQKKYQIGEDALVFSRIGKLARSSRTGFAGRGSYGNVTYFWSELLQREVAVKRPIESKSKDGWFGSKGNKQRVEELRLEIKLAFQMK
jgi:hypothetical protein